MRIFGRPISKWWLVLLASLLLVCFPILLIGFFAANNFAGAIVGPPAIWNRPFHPPAQEDLVGRYVEYKRNWDHAKTGPDAVLQLKSDGTMLVSNLPNDDITSTCTIAGSGTWKIPKGDQEIDLSVDSNGVPDACKSNWYAGLLEIAGHSKPYELYWELGDPDSGTGIWLKKQ
jgi:hypothetical protein